MKHIFTAVILAALTVAPAQSCEVAQVLFGDIQLDIVKYPDYESAIVRHANFNDKKLNSGAIKGEITVDRGSFAVRNTNNEVIGIISPQLAIEGQDGCDKAARIVIKRTAKDVFTILSGNKPVGTIAGRFPKNSFGVK